MKYHLIAFMAGFCLDLLFGDPGWLPHPVRGMGRTVSALERALIGAKGNEREGLSDRGKLIRGGLLVFLVWLTTVLLTAAVLVGAYLIYPPLGVVLETIMTYQVLAVRDLWVESMKVYECLQNGTLSEAREAVSMIVGRDTEVLDETGVAKAAIETVAENTSDGVLAPMLYTAFGGPILGMGYKAINTMDSMLGYKNKRYMYFGRVAARLDDVVNLLPSRISAWLMIAACLFCGKEYSAERARRIHHRDARKHASPNSAQTESVCAGALGIQLAGDAVYFGRVVPKPYIGDALRAVEIEDIRRANRLMLATAVTGQVLLVLVLAIPVAIF